MSSRVSRADLLAFLEKGDAETLGSVLDCFGYKHTLTEPAGDDGQSGAKDLPPSGDFQPKPEPPETLTSERPPEVYYVVQGQEASELLPASEQPGQLDTPEWVKSVEGEEPLDFQRARKRFSTTPPPHQPLVSWSKLWPVLHGLLSQQYTRKRPDIPKLVKQVAKAEQPSRIPQQQRQFWAAKTIILMDRPKRLDGLNQDYVQLQEQLEKQRGDTGLECWFVLDLALGKMLVGDERKKWHPPDPETPILILSDLGIYDDSGEATRQWLLFGKQLRRAGCKAFVLLPAPISYISDELSHCFQCISWDRVGHLKAVSPTATTAEVVQQRMKKDLESAENLLMLASAATDIEADFLRSLRCQFTVGKPWHIGHELLAWNHEVVEYSSNAVVLDAETQGEYRDRLAALLSRQPELAKPLYFHIREQLAHAFTLDYVDALCFLGWLAGIEGDKRLDEAELYLKQFILFTHQQDQHRGLAFNSHLLLCRQDAGSLRQKKFYSSLWAIGSSRSTHPFPRPDWLDHRAANAFLAQATARKRVQLIQLGESFYLGTTTVLETLQVPGFPFSPYVLAEVDIDQDLVIEEYEGEAIDLHLKDDALLQWPVDGKPRVLHLGGQRLEIDTLVKPEWAGEISLGAGGLDKLVIQPTGEDEYGVYFDLVLPDNIVIPYIAQQTSETAGLDINIIYAAADKSAAMKMQSAFEDLGYTVWSDRTTSPGTRWNYDIHRPLKKARCSIVIWSEQSVTSDWVLSDSKFAYENGKLIPVKIDECEAPFDFGALAYLNLKNWAGKTSGSEFMALYRAINRYCRRTMERGNFVQRFRYIPPQVYIMGSPERERGRADDEIQHEVALGQGYWIADTTVTQNFWGTMYKSHPNNFEGGSLPVDHVSWKDAQAFISLLKKQFPLLEIRLPTEAEWECACRAGTKTAFSFGDDITSKQVNHYDEFHSYNRFHDDFPKAVDVKSLPENSWGLYGMHGNVSEWCQDGFREYSGSPIVDLLINRDENVDLRVVRGGSFNSPWMGCRSAHRFGQAPEDRGEDLGIRLALGHPSCSTQKKYDYQHLYGLFTKLDVLLTKYYFPILIDLARNAQTISYSGLVDRAKSEYPDIEIVLRAYQRNVRHQLYVVSMFIGYHGLPDITALVVSKLTGSPGTLHDRLSSDLHKLTKTMTSIFEQDWSEWQEEFDQYNRIMMEHTKDQ